MPAPLALAAKAGKAALSSRRAQDAVGAAALVAGHGAKAKGSAKKYPDPVASRGRTSKQRDR